MLKNLIILLVVVTCVLASQESKDSKDKEIRKRTKFNSHLRKHRKNYENLPEEVRVRRRENYLKNLDLIEKHNKEGKHRFKLGSNAYSDRHPERFVDDMCGTKIPQMTRSLPLPPAILASTTPASPAVDWRPNYTQPIVNQGQCACCWAFSAVSVVEAFNEIRGKGMTAMSPQNLVDCDTTNSGCNGGWPRATLDFIKSNYGTKLANSINYPYTSGTTKVAGSCKSPPSVPLNFTTPFQFFLNGNATALKKIISNYGPVAIAMQVSSSGLFQNYKTGIFSDASCPGPNQCGTVNHAMVAVGYGSTAGQEYFIVRNSWGSSWGESGYIRMAMGNTCNVACWAIGVE
ncbi:cathepsin K-like [Chironomus tepperi]|uniref:cathepsin K-like n=1 Tax=Chironomus tepperi TaxID=113505 RepID=UPI00391FB954